MVRVMTEPRYQLIRPLSEGGAGRVWLAEDRHDHGRRVALKRLHPGVDVAVLSREFDVLRGLSHPNLAQVLDFVRGEDGEQPFLTEAYVGGPDLRIACEGLPLVARGRLLAQVLRGLEYVHARGVVHGDVKPENILVTGSDGHRRACLIDFGLAARTGEAGDGIAGTAGYLAPEVIREQPSSPQADLYSFGVTAFEVLCGRRPFDQSDPADLLRAHLDAVPPVPTQLRPELPPTLDRVLLRLLEKEPSDRPGSAREALRELTAALGLRLETETAETLKAYLRSGRLVGRATQLARARALSDTLRAQTPSEDSDAERLHLLWWWGAAGSGRSRLLRLVSGDALIDGSRAVQARAGEAGTFGAVRTWLRALGSPSNPLVGARDRWDTIDRAAAELIRLAGDTPTVLTLDDAERADELTLDLLRVLVDRIASAYVPGAAGAPPRLVVVASGLEPPDRLAGIHSALYEVQALAPLTEAELRAWLTRLVPSGTGLPDEFVSGVFRLTDGLPGHVVALLAAMAERGHLRILDGALVVEAEALSAPLPASIRDALAEREARLPAGERSALEVLRVLDQAAPARLVVAVSDGVEATAIEQALVRLTERGLVGVVRDGAELRYRAEGGGAALSEGRRVELHGRIARSLMGLGGREAVAGFGMARVAWHARAAVQLGESRLAAAGYRAALAAAAEARDVHAGADEARLVSWAMELAPGGERDRRPLAIRLGALYQRLGRFDEAVEALESVRREPDASADERDQVRLGLAGVARARGDFPAAHEHASSVDEDRPQRALALGLAARALLMMGRYDEASAACADGLGREPGAAAEAELRGALALVHYYTEQPDRALPEFRAAAEACVLANDPVGHATAINGVGLIHHRRGEFDAALAAYEESLRIAQQSGERKRVSVAAMNIGTVLHETGRVVAAAERYRESLQVAELLGDSAGVAKAANNLGNLLIYLNRLAEARYWLDRSTAEAETQQARLLVAYNKALVGKIHHREGDIEGARRALLTAVSALREMGNAGEAGELFIELGLVSRTAGDVDGIEHFAASAARAAEASGAEKQLAHVKFLRGEARRMAGDLAGAIPLLRSALVLADRHRLLDLGWTCEAGLARAYREQGNAMEARARFNACSERIFAQASSLSGRDRDLFLADSARAAMLEECRLSMGDGGALPTAAREGHDQLVRLMEINRRLVSERDLQRLLDFILDSAVALTGAERGFVILCKDERGRGDFRVRAARNIDQESLRKNRTKVSRSIAQEVIDNGEPVLTVDAGEDVRFRDSSSVHHLKLRSILCFPLKVHGVVIGAIYLDNRFQTSTFSDRDLAMIGAFADQAAVAITNAWLHERSQRAQEDLEASHRRIEALNLELTKRVDDQAARLAEFEANLERQRSQLETRYRYDNIIGAGPAMRRIFAVLDRVTDTSVPVLIEGESGTGKELVARAIHYNGPARSNRTFVSVNCAALTETLLESELFGHVKGAFTGADRDRKGLFEVADGGSLFLDEVADMSLGMQAKLLRALQEGEIWPVGARRSIRVDARIIAACNRDLDAMVKSKEFRQDLYFRLNVVRIQLPPLRRRGEDLVLLVQHFLRRFTEKHGGPVMKISQSALDRLLRYAWPGNIRELEACLMNGCLFCDTDTLTEAHFTHKPELFEDNPAPAELDGPSASPTRLGGELLDLGNMMLRELEEKAILAALDRTGGNKVEAARRLGITRQTLYNKLKSLGIEVRRRVRRS